MVVPASGYQSEARGTKEKCEPQERAGDEGCYQAGLPRGSWNLVFRKILGRGWCREQCGE